MIKSNYVLYLTLDNEIHYYILADNIRAAARQVKIKYPNLAVKPYALTAVTEGDCGKVNFRSWYDTHNGDPEIYKFR